MNRISFLNRGYAFKGLLAVTSVVVLIVLCLGAYFLCCRRLMYVIIF